MIFKEITLENFRQYRGTHSFEFPVNDDKKITLLIARNGVGKTTFLQAFRFCFYGENQGALKLPKSDELITNSLEYRLSNGEQAPVMVTIKFAHDGHDYIAKRKIMFQMERGRLKKLNSSSDETFELLEDNEVQGWEKVENGEKRINQMMPLGLAHVYMFDGERVEMPISSKEFQNGVRKSIVGILGLEKLQQAYSFLGDKNQHKTVIGKVWAKLQPISSDEQSVLDREKQLRQENGDILKEISDKERAIQGFDEDIAQGREAQSRIDELKHLKDKVISIEKDVKLKRSEIDSLVHKGNVLAVKLLLKLKVASIYKKYQQFIKSADDTQEIYENLYSTVIDDVLKRGICICGRPVHEGDECAKYLKELIVLPQNNASYLNNLAAMFKSLDDMPEIRVRLNQCNNAIMVGQDELEELQKKQDNAESKLKETEKKIGGAQNQINIEKIRGYKATFEHRILVLNKTIEKNNDELSKTKGKINRIKFSTEHNQKVSNAIEMLENIKKDISIELENKKKIAKDSIQKNMNIVLRGITDQRYADFQVELDKNYQLTVYKNISDTDEYEDMTEVLSTGENVVMYLAFLRALLLTINQHSEFSDVSKNGVIMDAALSNLDEEHIKQISTRILSKFDQLIFLSYKGQLRNELVSGIKNNISKVYELTKNVNGNIEQIDLPIDEIEDYVNRGVEE